MRRRQKKAFTLIEILISSAIFAVTLIIATAVFTNTIGSRSKVQVLRDTTQTARIIMEDMATSIRMANGFYDPDSGAKTNASIDITNNNGTLILLYTDFNTKARSMKLYCLCNNFLCNSTATRLCSADTNNPSIGPITPDNVKVSNLRFTGQEDVSSNLIQQPFVNISFTIAPATSDPKVVGQNTLDLETRVTSRDYNYSWFLPKP